MKRILFPDRVPVTVNLSGFIMISVFEMNFEELPLYSIFRGSLTRKCINEITFSHSFKMWFSDTLFLDYPVYNGLNEGYNCVLSTEVIYGESRWGTSIRDPGILELLQNKCEQEIRPTHNYDYYDNEE